MQPSLRVLWIQEEDGVLTAPARRQVAQAFAHMGVEVTVVKATTDRWSEADGLLPYKIILLDHVPTAAPHAAGRVGSLHALRCYARQTRATPLEGKVAGVFMAGGTPPPQLLGELSALGATVMGLSARGSRLAHNLVYLARLLHRSRELPLV